MSRTLRAQLFLLDNLIWVILLGFFLINMFITPQFATYGNLVNILYHSSIMSMLVLGQGLILMSGNLDLSLESTLAFAPGMAMLFAVRWLPFGLHPVLTLILTLIIGFLVGMFNGYFISKIKVNPLLQTLSTMIILRGVVLFLVPFSIYPLSDVYRFAGSARIAGNIPFAVVLMLVTYLIFHVVLQYTTIGRRYLATGGNPKASYISGINTTKMVMYGYAVAGVLAAIAGIMTAGRQGSVTNSMGDGNVLLSFAGAILGGASLHGGKGTAIGMLGGALLLGMFSNSLNLLGVEVTLVEAAKGALIFLAIIIDRVKIKVRSNLLYKEQAKQLEESENIKQCNND
ncbi:ABC transporter permease [Natranaerofaba carboxydovora]|uniref:ABC transporter permease n=1 Tax=Natranaerofaba carboxydovora TaxID=2742683 RepID=UPI001F142A84|nr:ABC transporter permease [Natranaerofaba carboxydovora]UMZ74337.1 Ribose import permease protein RbsC [Natranaerofaba carboxydovora]